MSVGTIDLAGGRMGGGTLAYFCVVREKFFLHNVCVSVYLSGSMFVEWGGGGSNVNSENTFVCLPLCDCVNQGI